MPLRPLVSIIIDNYNYSRFLTHAIDSALNQTHPNVEVIVVDDGSTDESGDIMLGYGDCITAIFKPNGGQASALNLGFAHAHGDIVIFLDADDVLLPETAGRVAQAFYERPGTAKVQYRVEIIDERGERSGQILPYPHQRMPSGFLAEQVMKFPADLVWLGMSGNAFAACVLRSILPIPEQEFRTLADYYLCHLAPLFGPIVSLEEVGALYRIHGSNSYSSRGLNLGAVRDSATHWQKTRVYIADFANRLGLPGRPSKPEDILSVAHVINRAISLKLEPSRHPFEEDNLWRLLTLGAIASARRFDVSFAMKLLYVLWFAALVLAPKPFDRWLAEQAMVPPSRGRLNRLLGRLQPTGPVEDYPDSSTAPVGRTLENPE
ncbi:MAG: glycosyltransferase [Anaerolineae bacterium]